MKIKPLAEIKEFCAKIVAPIGVSVYDVEFKNGDYPTLNIVIDKEGGVDLDTCEKVSNLLDAPLDEFDPTFSQAYSLNVSSKGIDWAFRTHEDFVSHIGKRVEVRLKSPIKGKKFYDGILTSYDQKAISIKIDDKTAFTVEMKNVVKVNEYIDFD